MKQQTSSISTLLHSEVKNACRGFCRTRGYQGVFCPRPQTRKTAVFLTGPPFPAQMNIKPQGRVADLTDIQQHSKAQPATEYTDIEHARSGISRLSGWHQIISTWAAYTQSETKQAESGNEQEDIWHRFLNKNVEVNLENKARSTQALFSHGPVFRHRCQTMALLRIPYLIYSSCIWIWVNLRRLTVEKFGKVTHPSPELALRAASLLPSFSLLPLFSWWIFETSV